MPAKLKKLKAKKKKVRKKTLLLQHQQQQQQEQQQIVQISLHRKQIQPRGRQHDADTKAFFRSVSRFSLSIEIALDWGNLLNTFNSPIVKRELNFERGSDETMHPPLAWRDNGGLSSSGAKRRRARGYRSAAVTRRPHLADCSGRHRSVVTDELFRHLGRDSRVEDWGEEGCPRVSFPPTGATWLPLPRYIVHFSPLDCERWWHRLEPKYGSVLLAY